MLEGDGVIASASQNFLCSYFFEFVISSTFSSQIKTIRVIFPVLVGAISELLCSTCWTLQAPRQRPIKQINFFPNSVEGIFMEESKTMYPRVKVRQEKEEDEDEFDVDEDYSFEQEETCSLPLVRILESVSLEELSSPGISSAIEAGKDSENDFPPSVSRVPVEVSSSISMSKGENNSKEIEEETRIRASSILRPRAVVSSPDNDWMIGSRNRLARERTSNLKKYDLGQKSPTQVKVNCIKAATPMSRRRGSHESGDHKSHLDEKKDPHLTVPNQKTCVRKEKPSWVPI